MRTTVTVEGNLADDPQTRFTPSGKQITEITVLVNQRRQNSDGEWVDVGPGMLCGRSRRWPRTSGVPGEGGSGLRARDCDHGDLDRQALW
jgi:hypothetical protein